MSGWNKMTHDAAQLAVSSGIRGDDFVNAARRHFQTIKKAQVKAERAAKASARKAEWNAPDEAFAWWASLPPEEATALAMRRGRSATISGSMMVLHGTGARTLIDALRTRGVGRKTLGAIGEEHRAATSDGAAKP